MLLSQPGEYATFKQWQDLGGHVKKGAKGEMVVFWKIYQKEETNDDGDQVIKNIPVLRYYTVFHISQVDGVEPLSNDDLKPAEPIAEAEKLLADYVKREGIKLIHSVSDKAYYSPASDAIHLPEREQFTRIEEYYGTAFHEATHSTMTSSRCNRKAEMKIAAFGSEDYSKEELVAEIGSASILNMLGIESEHSIKNNAAYVQSWLRALKNDSRFIVSAASKAEKAVEYIVG